MSTMAETCWVLTDANGADLDEMDYVVHYSTRALAEQADVQATGYRPRQLDAPCVTPTCACCENDLGEAEEDHILHLAAEEVEQVLPHYGWKPNGDGTWRCETCVTGPCDLEADTHG